MKNNILIHTSLLFANMTFLLVNMVVHELYKNPQKEKIELLHLGKVNSWPAIVETDKELQQKLMFAFAYPIRCGGVPLFEFNKLITAKSFNETVWSEKRVTQVTCQTPFIYKEPVISKDSRIKQIQKEERLPRKMMAASGTFRASVIKY